MLHASITFFLANSGKLQAWIYQVIKILHSHDNGLRKLLQRWATFTEIT